jgi:small-conductance mechanosensitive channel
LRSQRISSFNQRIEQSKRELHALAKTYDTKDQTKRAIKTPLSRAPKDHHPDRDELQSKRYKRTKGLINYLKTINNINETSDNLSSNIMKLLERATLDRQILFKEKVQVLLQSSNQDIDYMKKTRK